VELEMEPNHNLQIPSGPQDHQDEVDESILEYNLSLTYEERLENHQRSLEVLQEILKARKALYGVDVTIILSI
jgi:hypothetical protein